MEQWGIDIGEDFILPACVNRNSFCKGAVVCVDFQQFAYPNFPKRPTSYCDWCGGFALAIMHLSLKCFYHSKQHVIANLSQTIACQLLSSNPTRVIFHSFNLHFAPFPWSVWCGNVPSRERPAFIYFNCTYYYLHFQRI